MARKCLVSFVVLNWNGLDDTLLCLDSIRQQSINDYEIIVVDNGSSLQQKQQLQDIPDIKLIDLPNNTGFTGGQIAAYNIANGEYMALVNNDSVIAKTWATQAIAVLKRNPKAAAVGGRAYCWDDSGQNAFDTSNDFYSYQIVNPITGHTKTLTYGDRQYSVNSISGAGVVIRKDVIDKLGYFDNRFFAYYEETDLFARYKRAGYQVLYSPDMHIWHKIAQSSRSNPHFYLYQMHRNRFIFGTKNFDRPYFRKFVAHYLKETITALGRITRHGKKSSVEETSLLKAALWNLFHLGTTLKQRQSNIDGKSSYVSTLTHDKTESVSVVIPCYNYEQYVAEAIESVLEQTTLPDEIIVINDGSTDNSLKIINHYSDRVKVIDQKNQGVVATKNRGIKEAIGEWIIFLDADDKLQKDYMTTLLAAAQQHNASVAYCGMRFFGHESGVFESRPFTPRSIRKGNYINNSALMRRSLLESVGGYNDRMASGFEDWELYVSLAEIGTRFWYISTPMLLYRRHQIESRDAAAKKQLETVRATIRELHPNIFSIKHRIYDLLHTIVTLPQRRSPWKVLVDFRYTVVKKLDRYSINNRPLNQFLGFMRLLGSWDFKSIIKKLGLNMKRLWKKISN